MTVTQEISPQQAELASWLGISLDESTSLRQLMLELDNALGQQYLLEQARFFIISTYRHLTKANWDSVAESGLSLEQQYELAEIYISSDKFTKSLIRVLRDPRTRFTLLEFATSRNLEKRTLSTTTKAYQHAKEILAGKELIATKSAAKRRMASVNSDSHSQTDADKRPGANPAVGYSVINRRAARRGLWASGHAGGKLWIGSKSVRHATSEARETTMSEEEFAELEEDLSSSKKPEATNWTYETNEERLSLALGLVAGGVFCTLVLWMLI